MRANWRRKYSQSRYVWRYTGSTMLRRVCFTYSCSWYNNVCRVLIPSCPFDAV